MNILESKWGLSDPSGLIPTYPSSSPKKKIDYVLFYPYEAWEIVEIHVIDDKIASDHCPYLVVLNLKHKAKD
jgi:endonuclease/exonuclease/phosphatase family metal-dependent hydrolase